MSAFNLETLLRTVIGYKGLPFPGGFFPDKPHQYVADEFSYSGEERSEKTHSDLGSVLRKKDAQGRWYFMPVALEYKGKEYEMPNAVISIRGKKTIVETAMVGRKGTVKELISVSDYEINIAGKVQDTDFPDKGIADLNELYNINESVILKCALTDIFLDDDDMVVIKDIEFAEIGGSETVQVFKMSLVTDRGFELIID
ncbi:hypothetical protein EZS27_015566 [termite gut metagenome]|uniref:DUF6046 domain-containing protein n=1 Tax=termite gut metagenome TaxID=433724 RepID=A0A5J4RRE0_9ZZZZ